MQAVAHTEKARSALRLLEAGIVQASELAMRSAMKVAEDSARGTTRFVDRTGGTRASIRSERAAGRGFVVAGGAAGFLENGTRAHIIRGNPVLRFSVNGQVLFRRWVRHPGTQPRPFMHEARDRAQQAAVYGVEYFVNYAIGK